MWGFSWDVKLSFDNFSFYNLTNESTSFYFLVLVLWCSEEQTHFRSFQSTKWHKSLKKKSKKKINKKSKQKTTKNLKSPERQQIHFRSFQSSKWPQSQNYTWWTSRPKNRNSFLMWKVAFEKSQKCRSQFRQSNTGQLPWKHISQFMNTKERNFYLGNLILSHLQISIIFQ